MRGVVGAGGENPPATRFGVFLPFSFFVVGHLSKLSTELPSYPITLYIYHGVTGERPPDCIEFAPPIFTLLLGETVKKQGCLVML